MKTLLLLFITLAGSSKSSEAQPLASYPVQEKLWIGAEKAQIIYQQKDTFSTPSEMKLSLHSNASVLEKDQHWATFNLQSLKQKRKEYQLEQKKTELLIDNLKEESIKTLIALENRLNKINKNIRVLKNSIEFEEMPPQTKQRIQKALNTLTEQKNSLTKKITSKAYLKESDLQKEELELTLEQKRQDLENLEYRSQLKSTFKGEITFQIPKEKLKKLQQGDATWIPASKTFAEILNKESLAIEVLPQSNTFQQLDSKKVTLQIPYGPLGKIASASFDSFALENSISGSHTKWIFKTPNKDDLHEFVNKTLLANLFITLPEQTHVIPKAELIQLHPEILEKQGWRGLIHYLWPNTKIVHIGPYSIAVRSK